MLTASLVCPVHGMSYRNLTTTGQYGLHGAKEGQHSTQYTRLATVRYVMSRRKQRSAFDQVSEFDRGRIVAYRDCACEIPLSLLYPKNTSKVSLNQCRGVRQR
ncbi:hypothetical protein TNCV_1519121 [Trichonephila clavipes]|nr:hypothetical protein TNCV_1519121 [Trichonephila clavipes]